MRTMVTAVTVGLLTLAGCGGEEGLPAGAVTSVPAPSAPGPAPTEPPLGQVTIKVTDAWGSPLPNATFNFGCNRNSACSGWPTDANGISVLSNVRGDSILARHPLGWKTVPVTITAGAMTTVQVAITPFLEPAATILAASLSAPLDTEGRERELRLKIAVSGGWDGNQADGYDGALSWLMLAQVAPCIAVLRDLSSTCPGEGKAWVPLNPSYFDHARAPGYRIQGPDTVDFPSPLLPSDTAPYSALLLLDQGRRAVAADAGKVRYYAARNFLLASRPFDQVSLAGYAGDGGDSSSPRLLPTSPLWVPPSARIGFSNDHGSWVASLPDLLPRTGGSSPLYEAIDAGMDLIAGQVPAGSRRALVVLTGGDDDGALTDSQRAIRWSELLQKRQATGVEIILVAGHYREMEPEERARLADLAAAGLGTLVTTSSADQSLLGGYFDDYYSGLDLAADLLGGRAPSLELKFRLRMASTAASPPGSVLRGELILGDNCEPGWWYCRRAVPFVVKVP